MFTGLTNQMSGWMGSVVKKGEGEAPKPDEKVEPAEDLASGQENNEAKKDASPTKPGSRMEMLSNVKSQMSGWLGSAAIPSIPSMPAMPSMPSIPGLRKGGDEEGAAPTTDAGSPASEKSVKGSPNDPKEDDDNSSATGGADSNAEMSDNEGEELEKDGAVSGVSTKAIQGAKSFGGFLYSAVSKAGAKVSEAGAKIKKTVEENNLLGDFNKEQEAFIKDKNSKGSEAAVPPWVGCPNEESLKEECLSLSTDRRNFVRSPPTGVDFNFDFEVSYPVAQAILAEDPNLEKMRFELVPKVINEENFWRNYFYRVSLICQANELSSMAKEGGPSASRTSSTDAEPAEEEWEKELEAELQDYEVVADNDGQNTNSSNWENQIEDMLDDETDLK